MITKKTTRIALLLTILLGMFVFEGCNTWKGAGKDIERGGEKMQGEK